MISVLRTFQLVNKDQIISPILTTTREYGRWFESVFDEYTTSQEIYLKAKKGDTTVLESHPGTKIGSFFDKKQFSREDLKCWYILQDSTMMKRLVKYQLAELRDAIPISVNDAEHRNMIRVFTAAQIELYIRSNIDKKFNIAPYIDVSKQVVVKDGDMDKLVRPIIRKHKASLF